MFTAFNNIIPILQVRTLRISEIKSLSQGCLARNQHTEDLNPEFILFTLPLKMEQKTPGGYRLISLCFPSKAAEKCGLCRWSAALGVVCLVVDLAKALPAVL